VEVNPTLLNSLDLNLEDVHTALAAMNANRPKGEFSDSLRTFSISTTDQILKAAEYQPLIIGYNAKTGGYVRLADVANVIDSVEDVRTGGSVNGKPSIVLVIFRQPGANMIETVDRVLALLPTFRRRSRRTSSWGCAGSHHHHPRLGARRADLAAGLHLPGDSGGLRFLSSVRSTVIPGIAVPISLIGTFGVMYCAITAWTTCR